MFWYTARVRASLCTRVLNYSKKLRPILIQSLIFYLLDVRPYCCLHVIRVEKPKTLFYEHPFYIAYNNKSNYTKRLRSVLPFAFGLRETRVNCVLAEK